MGLLDENKKHPETEGKSAASPGGWVFEIQDSPCRSRKENT